jgi:hypothetical protein
MILLTISIVYLTYLIPILLDGESNGARAAAGGAVILIICEVCLRILKFDPRPLIHTFL